MFNDLEKAFNFMGEDMRVSDIGTVGNIVVVVANIFVYIAFGLSFVAVAFSFIQFVTSSGDPKSTGKAQKSLSWGIAGMVISVLAYALKGLILRTLGVSDMY